MSGFSRSLSFQPQEKTEQPHEELQPVLGMDSLFAELPPIEFTWAEGSTIVHTRARCSRYRAIEENNRRRQKSEPQGMTLCAICRDISLLGRKG